MKGLGSLARGTTFPSDFKGNVPFKKGELQFDHW